MLETVVVVAAAVTVEIAVIAVVIIVAAILVVVEVIALVVCSIVVFAAVAAVSVTGYDGFYYYYYYYYQKQLPCTSCSCSAAACYIIFMITNCPLLCLMDVSRLKLQHDRLTSQWKTQQRQVRMAAIFAAIRQIKNWDLKKVCKYCFLGFRHLLSFVIL